MSDPENKPNDKSELPKDRDDKKESENILKILDELLTHTNSSRRMFLVFIASALFFGPAALVLGGVLLEHPQYNIRHLENQQGGPMDFRDIPGAHMQLVDQNGTVIRELPPMEGERPHLGPIFAGLRIFIIISIIFAAILLWVAIKEYRFFSHWNKKFARYKTLSDKIDKELEDEK